MQISNGIEPFGEVNGHPQNDGRKVSVASTLMEPTRGVAIDGSGSMRKACGVTGMLPALLTFKLPPGATSFSQEVAGQTLTRPIQ